MRAADTTSIDAGLAAAHGYFQRDEPARAEELLRALFARAPGREDVAMLLAQVLRSHGRLSGASQVLLDLSAANDFEPALALRAASFARQCDRHAVAGRICAGAIARGTVSAELLALAGNVAREAGDFERARGHYLAALDAGIDLNRHHVPAALANTRTYTDAADPDIARFAHWFADGGCLPRARASAGFALAKAQNDLADYAAAAATLRKANAMVQAERTWSAAAWAAFVRNREHERTAASRATAPDTFVPVFIVGVPRSGTTLTATLLARATGARDRGELRALRFIAEQLIAGGHLGAPSALAEAATLYRTMAVQDDAPATWYLDQDPLNFRYLHVVAALFPQARVIHLRRDPRDTALSLWSQDFAHPDLAFAYAFDDIARHMQGHAALMRHWRGSLDLPIHELDYESLVEDPDRAITALADFIGAPVRTTAAARDDAPVQSASVWQARQPVYATSVGRWKHYAPYVPEVVRFG